MRVPGGVVGHAGARVRDPAQDHVGGLPLGQRQRRLQGGAPPAQAPLPAESPAAQRHRDETARPAPRRSLPQQPGPGTLFGFDDRLG